MTSAEKKGEVEDIDNFNAIQDPNTLAALQEKLGQMTVKAKPEVDELDLPPFIMKRVNAPKQWYLGKLKGVYGTKPSAGPHKTRECIPLNVLLQQRLKYAMSNMEATKIVKDKEGLIKVDGKIRRDPKFPLGTMDVVTIEKTNEHFRILYDIKGRFQPHRVDAKEGEFKLCKVVQKKIGKSKVPHIVTHDGRTIRFPHPDIQINDSVKVSIL